MKEKPKFPKRKRGIFQNRQVAAHRVLERRQIVSDMYVRGKTQMEITKEVGVSQGVVSKDLAAIRQEWLASSLVDFNERKAIELAKIDDTERLAMEQFVISTRPERSTSKRVKRRRSKDEEGDGAEITIEAVRGVEQSTKKGQTRFKNPLSGKQIVAEMKKGDGSMVDVEETVEKTKRGKGEGNPDWIRIRQWCINQRCLILGLLKPPDVTVNNNLGIDWSTIHATRKDTDEVEERIQEAEVLAIKGGGSSSAHNT